MEREATWTQRNEAIQDSLIQRAFQMNPVRVLCLIYFGNPYLMYFFTYVETALLKMPYFTVILFDDKYKNMEDGQI